MKRIFFAFLFMVGLFAHAQTATVTLSNKFELKDRGLGDATGATCHLGNFFYCMQYDYKSKQFAIYPRLNDTKYNLNFYRYTADMKELAKTALSKGKKEFGPFPPQAIVLNNKLLLFYYHAQDDGSVKLLLTTIEPETLAETGTRELYTMPVKNVSFAETDGAIARNRLILVMSPNQKELMVAQSGNTNQIFTCIINNNNEMVKPSVTIIKDNFQDMAIQNAFLDNEENKCLSYTYTINKIYKRGVLVSDNRGKDTFMDFDTGRKEWESNKLSFHMANDNSTLYVYANYYGDYMDEGVLLATLNIRQLAYGPVRLFPYSNDIKEKLYKMGFGVKSKDAYTVKRVDYTCTELADGTLALTGYPSVTSSDMRMKPTIMNTNTLSANGAGHAAQYQTVDIATAGPIINVFLKGGQCKFGLLYRKQSDSEASGYIPVAYKNQLICIYCDSKENLEQGRDEKVKGKDRPSDMVLVEAVIAADGTVISRSQIADTAIGSNYYYLDHNKQVTSTSYLIPVGRLRLNMARYYTEIVQWANVEVK
jgi:hypothetical protein